MKGPQNRQLGSSQRQTENISTVEQTFSVEELVLLRYGLDPDLIGTGLGLVWVRMVNPVLPG